MGRIQDYAIDATPESGDILLGTNVLDAKKSKNYSIQSIVGLVPVGPAGTQAVAYLGVIDELNPKYCVDVMSLDIITFGANEIYPVNCLHAFVGYDINADGPVENAIDF